jgi:hypothetical protein
MHAQSLRFALPAALAALLLQAPQASALPTVRVSWNDCTPLQIDQDADGQPAYAWNVSAVGMTGKYVHFYCFFQFAPDYVARAWQ